MTALDRILPEAALVERHHIDIAAPAACVWEYARHLDLARIPWVRLLFTLRTLPDRIAGHAEPPHICIDDLVSSPDAPGFQVLSEDPPHEVVVGAIGKVWRAVIPFVHVEDADAFAKFAEHGFIKVAWAIRVGPRPLDSMTGDAECRAEVEVRVCANDPASWRKFRRYFRVIGPASRLIRRAALACLTRDVELAECREGRDLTVLADHLDGGLPLATPEDIAEGLVGAAIITLSLMTPFLRGAREHWGLTAREASRVYPGDDLIPTPRWLWTHAAEIHALRRQSGRGWRR